MKNVLKKTGKVLIFLFLYGLLTAVFCGLAFIIYANTAKGLSASEFEKKARLQDRTTRLYYMTYTDADHLSGYASEMESEALYASENREWVSTERIPDNLINAFVSIEDHRFFSHKGVDLKRTAGAVLGFVTGKSSYGGSTITQQLIKNVSGENSYSVRRKIRELISAYRLERRLDKSEILELYLNTIYLSENSYGVGVAAENYFGKDISELSLTECAALACIPQSPAKWDPITHPENNKTRRKTVLSRMYSLGYITEEEYLNASESEIVTVKKDKEETAGGIHSWYTEAVINDAVSLLTINRIASDTTEAKRLVYTGGLRIITAENPEMQEALENYFSVTSNFYSGSPEKHPECAIVVIEPKTGNILALAGAVGAKQANRTLSFATDVPRSPGSSIKPLSVYAPALDKGIITYGSVIDDTPVTFIKKSGGGMRGWPMNYPVGYRGLTTIRDAVSRSVNTVAVKVLHELGRENSFDFLKNRLHFSHLVENSTENGRFVTDVADSPLALGQMTHGVTVREITAAYTSLCDYGNYHESRTILKILDSDGNLLIDNSPAPEQVISEESASIMTRLLQNVTLSGTASLMGMKKAVECAGKTGTTSGDCDRWFVGYTPDLLAGVWFGYPDPESLDGYSTSLSPALRTWDNVMKEINTEKYLHFTPNTKFKDADGVVTATYCRDSGKIMTAACGCDPRGNRTETGYFTKESIPLDYCDRHVFVDYDIVNHGVASHECPPENLMRIGMLDILRSFPYDVKISDAQYTYTKLPEGVSPCLLSDQPFYLGLLPPGRYPGHSSTLRPFNRYCFDCLIGSDESADEE